MEKARMIFVVYYDRKTNKTYFEEGELYTCMGADTLQLGIGQFIPIKKHECVIPVITSEFMRFDERDNVLVPTLEKVVFVSFDENVAIAMLDSMKEEYISMRESLREAVCNHL